jgi:hypothetical protein
MTDNINPKPNEEQPHSLDLNNSDLNQMKETGMSQYPIDALEAFNDDLTKFANAYFQAEADGKIDLTDLPVLFTPAMSLIGDITGGKFKSFGAELGDVDSVEVETLKSDANTKIDMLQLTPTEKDELKAGYAVGIDLAHFYYCFKQNKAAQTPPKNA